MQLYCCRIDCGASSRAGLGLVRAGGVGFSQSWLVPLCRGVGGGGGGGGVSFPPAYSSRDLGQHTPTCSA